MADERKPMAHIAPFGLRMQPDLKAKVEEAARANNRSLNAEIVARIEQAEVMLRDLQAIEDVGYSLFGKRVPLSDFHEMLLEFSERYIEGVKESDKLAKQNFELHQKLASLIKRFHGPEGEERDVLVLPEGLLNRIRPYAVENRRTPEAEAIHALEEAFPEPEAITYREAVKGLEALAMQLYGELTEDSDPNHRKMMESIATLRQRIDTGEVSPDDPAFIRAKLKKA